MTYLPTNEEFIEEFKFLLREYINEKDEVLSQDALELKQSLVKIIKQTNIFIASESRINRLKALCGELWEHMHPNSKDCDVCKALKQRLKDEGVNGMKFDPTYAPKGYRAVEDKDWEGCKKCAFRNGGCAQVESCVPQCRPDKCSCYFVKDEVVAKVTNKTDVTLLKIELDELRAENSRLRDEILHLLKLLEGDALEGDTRASESEARDWMG